MNMLNWQRVNEKDPVLDMLKLWFIIYELKLDYPTFKTFKHIVSVYDGKDMVKHGELLNNKAIAIGWSNKKCEKWFICLRTVTQKLWRNYWNRHV